MNLRSAAVLLFVCSFTAPAQVAEFGVFGGGLALSGEDLGQGYSLDADWKLGGRMTLNTSRFLGGEFGYAYHRHKLRVGAGAADAGAEAGFAGHMGFANALAYLLPEGSKVRPFATGGVHFINYVWPGLSVTQGGGEMKFGLNYGGGIKFRVTDTWLVRGDFRRYWNGKPWTDFLGGSGRINMNEVSIGVAFTM
jgi:opacity protein-like surface antigen